MEEIRGGVQTTGDWDSPLDTRLEQALTVLGGILRDIAVNTSPEAALATDHVARESYPPPDSSTSANVTIVGGSLGDRTDRGSLPPAQP